MGENGYYGKEDGGNVAIMARMGENGYYGKKEGEWIKMKRGGGK